MIISNSTRKTLLAKNATQAVSLIEKSIGLLADKKPKALIFSTRFGIHTIGMKFAIDVVVLNKQSRVVALKQELKPNTFFVWNPRFNRVIELPSGTIDKSKTTIGDHITLTEASNKQ